MHDRRLNSVSPGAPVLGARCCEGGPGNLLGIEPERRPLRRVAADRQGTCNRFGKKVIAEPRLVGRWALVTRSATLSIADLCLLLRDLGHNGLPNRPRQ